MPFRSFIATGRFHTSCNSSIDNNALWVLNVFHFSFFSMAQEPSTDQGSSFFRFLTHTKRHTTVCKTPLDEGPVTDLYLTTHNNHKKTDIHIPGGIQTRNSSNCSTTGISKAFPVPANKLGRNNG